MSGCSVCGRALYFSERVAFPSVLCFPCASARGLIRIADRQRYANLAKYSQRLEPWWRWTVPLEHALRWDERVRAKLEGPR